MMLMSRFEFQLMTTFLQKLLLSTTTMVFGAITESSSRGGLRFLLKSKLNVIDCSSAQHIVRIIYRFDLEDAI